MTGEAPGRVAVLSYASARNLGGGYLNGAQAQEEALCRGSALHATLLRAPEYYAHHRAERAFYTDRVIHILDRGPESAVRAAFARTFT